MLCRHYRRVSEERRNALELASRQQWMLMELEHERRKERDRLQKDEALRARELDEHVRRVKEVKREKVHRERGGGGWRGMERERACARRAPRSPRGPVAARGASGGRLGAMWRQAPWAHGARGQPLADSVRVRLCCERLSVSSFTAVCPARGPRSPRHPQEGKCAGDARAFFHVQLGDQGKCEEVL